MHGTPVAGVLYPLGGLMLQLSAMQVLDNPKGGACFGQRFRTVALSYQVVLKQLMFVGCT